MPETKFKQGEGEFSHLWYEVDDQGNIVYTPGDAPKDMTGVLTKDVEVTKQVAQPALERKYYTVTGYGDADLKGYHVSREGRQARRKAIGVATGTSLSGSYYKTHLTPIEKIVGRHLTRRDFKDPQVIQQLASAQFDKSGHASDVQNILYPEMSKKVEPAKLKTTMQEKEVPTYKLVWCKDCHTFKREKDEYKTVNRPVTTFTKAKYSTIKGTADPNIEYIPQDPLTVTSTETHYAIPQQGSTTYEENTYEIPVEQKVVRKPKTKPTGTRTGTSPVTKTVRKKAVSTNKVTEKWEITRDPAGNEVSRRRINKFGGKLNYLNLFTND